MIILTFLQGTLVRYWNQDLHKVDHVYSLLAKSSTSQALTYTSLQNMCAAASEGQFRLCQSSILRHLHPVKQNSRRLTSTLWDIFTFVINMAVNTLRTRTWSFTRGAMSHVNTSNTPPWTSEHGALTVFTRGGHRTVSGSSQLDKLHQW